MNTSPAWTDSGSGLVTSSSDILATGESYVVGETGYTLTDPNGLSRLRGKCGRSEITTLVDVSRK